MEKHLRQRELKGRIQFMDQAGIIGSHNNYLVEGQVLWKPGRSAAPIGTLYWEDGKSIR